MCQNTSTFAVRAAALLMLVGAVLAGAAAPTTSPATTRRSPLSASVTIHVRDTTLLSAKGITITDLEDAVERFTKSKAKYKLTELQALEVVGEFGDKTKLSDLAEVDVELENAEAASQPAGT